MNDGTTLFVSYSGLDGGAERILADVVGGLAPRPVVACPEGALAARARLAGARVVSTTSRPLALSAAAAAAHALEVRSLVRSLQPAVVVAWGARALLSCSAALAGTRPRPRFVFQHNDVLRRPAVRRAVRAAAARADLTLALSGTIARDLGLPGTRVVMPGVDLAAYAPERDAPRSGALLLGAIVEWKRPDLALEAVALAARELPELTLTVAGAPLDTGGERLLASLRERAARPDLAGRVRFVGALADPRPALTSARCLLHAADCEPFGVVLVEALACALPVVAPDACGPAEVIDSSCGRLYRPGDVQGAADALLAVLADPDGAASLGVAARARAERRHDLAAARAEYRHAIAAPPRRRDAGQGLALVTVLHDSLSELITLVASVRDHLPAAQLVVVDSGSSDGGAEWVRSHESAATVIELDANVGFGRASNAGVAAVSEPVTVLINPDVELVDSSLADLASEARRTPERLLAPLVLLPDGTRQDSVQPPPASPAALLTALVPPVALPPPLRRAAAPWRASRPRRVGWAVGACLVARTETLRRLGPFDERAFMYAEDLELGLRARDAGVETWLWPSARVIHHRAHASTRAFGGEPFGLLARRRREVVHRSRGSARGAADDAAQLVTFAGRIALKSILRRPALRERRQLRALIAALRGGARVAERPMADDLGGP